MNAESRPSNPTLDLTVRVGCYLIYETAVPTPIVLTLRPRRGAPHWWVRQERMVLPVSQAPEEYEDERGNHNTRLMLAAGRNEVRHDALVAVSSLPEPTEGLFMTQAPLAKLPTELLRYTLPSRYCDSDKLLDFAWQRFGQFPEGVSRVRAICDWVHTNIQYKFGSGRPDTSAFDTINNGYGVCRDFAHAAVALCRAMNLPARYVSGHLPDIGVIDPGTAMDFHAYIQVYLGDRWHTFDPRYNVPRIGRIDIATGLDAVDAAFSTVYGGTRLTWFEVWAYQVDLSEASLDEPVDTSKRLDGTPVIKTSRFG